MNTKTFARFAASAFVAASLMSACSDNAETPATPPETTTPAPTAVNASSAQDFKVEPSEEETAKIVQTAKASVTADNADEVADALEKEIEAELAAE